MDVFKWRFSRKLRQRIKLPLLSGRSTTRLGLIKLGVLFNLRSSQETYFLSFAFGCLSAFALFLFTKGPGLYSGGITGLTQGLARIAYAQTGNDTLYTILFWGLFVVVNIPLLVFSYFKISKKFTVKTIIYSLTGTGVGLLLDFTVPNGSFIRHIFGDALAIAQDAQVDNRLDEARQAGISLMAWYGSGPQAGDTAAAVLITLAYSVCSACCAGVIIASVYITGGSTGGTDIIAFYWADFKKKSVSSVISAVNIFSLLLGYLLGSYVAFGTLASDWSYLWLFSPIMFLSFLNVRLGLFIYNQLFPKDKLIEMKIVTEKADVIIQALLANNYAHGVTLSEASGGYSGKSKKVLTTTLSYYEILRTVGWIARADSGCFIQFNHVLSVMGAFSRRTVREQDQTRA